MRLSQRHAHRRRSQTPGSPGRSDADLRRRQPTQGHAHRPGHRGEVHRCGRRPSTTKVAELAEGKPVTIGADDSVEEALRTMKEHGVLRLPVIDGRELIGIVSQTEVAWNLPDDKIGDLVEAISSAPSNS